MLKENLRKISEEIKNGNNLGEEITLVGATKFVGIDRINEAISLGLAHIGENRAQEFRDKLPFYLPCVKHFIGTLQKNKLKYVVGKADIIDSVSSVALAEDIAAAAEKLGVKQRIMVEINAGGEESKSGATFSDAKRICDFSLGNANIALCGVMGMLPESDDTSLLSDLSEKLREFYDLLKKDAAEVKYLSVGMSSDYKIAIKHGSNAIRLGTALFGARY